MLAPWVEFSVQDTQDAGSDDALQIDTLVNPEALVFDGDKGVDQILGQIAVGAKLPVGALLHQRLDQIAFPVVDIGGKTLGRYVDFVDIGCGVDDALIKAQACADAYSAQ